MLNDFLAIYRARVESNLSLNLDQHLRDSIEPRLQAAMGYSLLNGGKRLRPILVYLANQVCGGSVAAADTPAMAIEAIHSYSLVHDDLPAMDNDALRRGKPTCHIKYDEATAILVGDALLTWAFELLSEPLSSLSPYQQLAMINCLAKASGDLGMVVGQSFDLQSVGMKLTIEQLRDMHSAKTGALINAALQLGALSADAKPEQHESLRVYGKAIGLAFQIKDDLLDIESDTKTLGKPQGSDLERDKPTYPALIGITESRHWLAELRQEAIASLDGFGSKADPLIELAHFITDRTH